MSKEMDRVYPYKQFRIKHAYLSHLKNCIGFVFLNRQMAENGFAPSPREFRRHILSCRELKADSFKKCLHSVRWGVSL